MQWISGCWHPKTPLKFNGHKKQKHFVRYFGYFGFILYAQVSTTMRTLALKHTSRDFCTAWFHPERKHTLTNKMCWFLSPTYWWKSSPRLSRNSSPRRHHIVEESALFCLSCTLWWRLTERPLFLTGLCFRGKTSLLSYRKMHRQPVSPRWEQLVWSLD